jgi:hypothetical protein
MATVALHLQKNWCPIIGIEVQVRFGNTIVRESLVDAVTDDNGILWLAARGSDSRQLFAREDGYQVCSDYIWETSQAARPITQPCTWWSRW